MLHDLISTLAAIRGSRRSPGTIFVTGHLSHPAIG